LNLLQYERAAIEVWFTEGIKVGPLDSERPQTLPFFDLMANRVMANVISSTLNGRDSVAVPQRVKDKKREELIFDGAQFHK